MKIEEGETRLCVPEICSNIQGFSFIGDVGGLSSGDCAIAVEYEKVDMCDYIKYTEGRDICLLAYVSVTNDTSVCGTIEVEYLKNECLK